MFLAGLTFGRTLSSLGITGASSILLSLLAGLLTFPSLLYLPNILSVALYKQTSKRGLQLQVQFRTFTGFPYIMAATATRLPYFGDKDTTFFQ